MVNVDGDCNICVTDERVKTQLPFNVNFLVQNLGKPYLHDSAHILGNFQEQEACTD